MTKVRLSRDDKVAILTGAGISAESGLRTFRDAGGLWEQYRFEDVASPEAWQRDPALVWRFYSQRREQARAAQPNPGHLALAQLERALGDNLFLCTQNVDGLHEAAGSRRVLHMHGELDKTRCEACDRAPFEDHAQYMESIPRCDDCGAQLRPHIVWFGEIPLELHTIKRKVQDCDWFITIGSSGMVYPAAGLIREMSYRRACGEEVRTLYVGLERPDNASEFDEIVLGKAGEVLPSLFEIG